MRENRPYGSEGGEVKLPDPYHSWGGAVRPTLDIGRIAP
jgi:hypothetical protein